MLENYEKPPLTFEDQVSKLIEKGLIVSDKKQAQKILSIINYYRLSAYWHPFKIRNTNVDFNDVIRLYEFDHHLRLLLIDAIERIEVAARTHISYVLSHQYGPFGYSDPNNFCSNSKRTSKSKFDHDKWLKKIKHEVERLSDKEQFIRHYKGKYEGFPIIPIWMLTEVMTLGSLSMLFSGMKISDKRSVAQEFQIHHELMGSWIHSLSYLRNICTHHSRLWNRQLAIPPKVPNVFIWKPPRTPTNRRIFFVLLIIREMLKAVNIEDLNIRDNWQSNVTTLIRPVVENPLWRNAMGFPEDWEEHPLWID